MTKPYSILVFTIFFLSFSVNSNAQVEDSSRWDNRVYAGNKYAWSTSNWRYTTELQFRLKDNTRSLDQYYIEGVATYMANKKLEIAPDFRFTVFPEKIEYRPGISLLYKLAWKNKMANQIAQQVKWQADIEGTGIFKHGVRYAIFYSRGLIEKKLAFSSGAGVFYLWSENFSGVQFVRALVGLTYEFNEVHILSINYMSGAENRATHWEFTGGPLLTFVIRINDNSKYIPARYINF